MNLHLDKKYQEYIVKYITKSGETVTESVWAEDEITAHKRARMVVRAARGTDIISILHAGREVK